MRKLLILAALVLTGCATPAQRYAVQQPTTWYEALDMQQRAQAQQSARQQQGALAAGLLGLQLMQMGAPHPAASAIINCNSIQQGAFTNTSCQ